MSSIIKAPFFAHKPYYFQCGIPDAMRPDIQMTDWSSDSEGDHDDQKLFNESFFDIEPFSGGTVTAAQKLMISALIERDELFEIDDKFVPVYFVFRTGNLTDSTIDMLFGDLITGLGVKSIISILFVTLTTLFLSLAAFAMIRTRLENSKSVDSFSEYDKSASAPLV